MQSLSLCLLLSACSLIAFADPQYPYNSCPPGYQIGYSGRCERIQRQEYPSPIRRPYPPQEDQNCPSGYKRSRGVCIKMTEREMELDRLPKDPCPPGERRSRLVCRPYP